MKSNGMIWGSMVINAALTLYFYVEAPFPGLEYLKVVFFALNVAGIALSFLGAVKLGAIVYIVGSVAFLPLGVIGIFAGLKEIDKSRRSDFLASGYGDLDPDVLLKEFRSSKMKSDFIIWVSSLYLVGLVLFAVFVDLWALNVVFVPVLCIAIGAWFKVSSPVKLYEGHMEVKLAPAMPVKLIRYSDILNVNRDKPKKIRIQYGDGHKRKWIKIPFNAVEKNFSADFGYFLHRQKGLLNNGGVA